MPSLTRIEKLGLLLNEIDECLSVDDDGNWFFRQAEITLDDLNIIDCKIDWEHGNHCGDCMNFPASCCVCFWAGLVERGSDLALALTGMAREGRRTIEQIAADDDDASDPVWKQVADKFRAEVVRLGLQDIESN